jgi:hypothetical protein
MFSQSIDSDVRTNENVRRNVRITLVAWIIHDYVSFVRYNETVRYATYRSTYESYSNMNRFVSILCRESNGWQQHVIMRSMPLSMYSRNSIKVYHRHWSMNSIGIWSGVYIKVEYEPNRNRCWNIHCLFNVICLDNEQLSRSALNCLENFIIACGKDFTDGTWQQTCACLLKIFRSTLPEWYVHRWSKRNRIDTIEVCFFFFSLLTCQSDSDSTSSITSDKTNVRSCSLHENIDNRDMIDSTVDTQSRVCWCRIEATT